jgi:hypothetical protein
LPLAALLKEYFTNLIFTAMKKIILIIFAVFLAGNSFSQYLRITDRLQKKIQIINPLEYTRILIILNDQLDIESLDKELYRINAPLNYRAQTVINALKQKAASTHVSLMEYLNTEKNNGKGKELINFWISNFIFAEATPDVIMNLSLRADIQMIDLE